MKRIIQFFKTLLRFFRKPVKRSGVIYMDFDGVLVNLK